MDRLRRVANIWNWLPAFRAVAEYESIQKAAVTLNVSPSALSRIAGDETTEGGSAVVHDFDGAHYRTTSVDEETAAAELLRGNLDLALVEAGAGLELPNDLTCERIGDLELALLAPTNHPMAARGDDVLEADEAAAKIVILAGATSHERSGRPVAIVGSIESAEQLAAQGPFLALLPRALAPPTFRVVASSAARMSVAAIYRRPLEKEAPALLSAIRTVVAA